MTSVNTSVKRSLRPSHCAKQAGSFPLRPPDRQSTLIYKLQQHGIQQPLLVAVPRVQRRKGVGKAQEVGSPPPWGHLSWATWRSPFARSWKSRACSSSPHTRLGRSGSRTSPMPPASADILVAGAQGLVDGRLHRSERAVPAVVGEPRTLVAPAPRCSAHRPPHGHAHAWLHRPRTPTNSLRLLAGAMETTLPCPAAYLHSPRVRTRRTQRRSSARLCSTRRSCSDCFRRQTSSRRSARSQG